MKEPLWLLVVEVLVAEDDDAALGDVERELLSAARVERVQLDAFDLGAELGRELVDVGAVEEAPRRRVLERLVPRIDVLERLERR